MPEAVLKVKDEVGPGQRLASIRGSDEPDLISKSTVRLVRSTPCFLLHVGNVGPRFRFPPELRGPGASSSWPECKLPLQ